ncbi:MAG: N-acetylmuramoyl-L-alanine amidase [Frankiales bacterium]|nr:N-acetylmuramoyl-L-alanine amidase [Frankiales bacterium]
MLGGGHAADRTERREIAYVSGVRTLVGRSVLVLLLAGLAVPGVVVPAAQAATPTAGQSTYVPVDPVRLFDTRGGQQLGQGGTMDVTIRGVDGVPDTATAVILNVTATRGDASTDIRVYPTPADPAAPPPTVSNLNVVALTTAANLVTVKLGDAGRVRFRNGAGSIDLIADLSGYFVDGPAGASYTGATPHRLLDTRLASQGPAFGPGQVRTLAVRGGSTGVPADASAVALNVTAVGPTRVTDLRVYPTHAGASPPTVSNLNPAPGAITAAAVIAAIGEDGTVSIRNAAGTVHVLVDVQGWYTAGTDAGVFHPLDPRRLLDTRSGPALAPGETRDLVVAGTGPVFDHPTPVPFSGRVVVLNVTAIAGSGTDVRVYPTPSDSSVPNASNINPSRGQTVPNTVLATVGRNGAIRLRNNSGDTHLIVDLSGWYGPAGDGWDISWPQCTAAGATTSTHPDGGAFAVVGVTHSPFAANTCFRDEYDWASSLPGGTAVYINADAPGTASAHWADPGPRSNCIATSSTDANCGWNYGDNLAGYAISQLAALPDKPQVFVDVENGPTWQTAGVNGNVVIAAINRLRAAGYRVGIYSNAKDWSQIVGGLKLVNVQNWTFKHSTDTNDPCSPAATFSGGDVVMTQYQVAGESPVYDHDHAC